MRIIRFVNQEDVLPDLPELADDGALADIDDGFAPDESAIITDDRAAQDLALGTMIELLDDGASALDDRVADVESEVLSSNEPESGWLDDAPMEVELGITFDERSVMANDSGQDGLEETPQRAIEGADDDASGLPAISPGSDGEGVDEPVSVPVSED